MVHRRVSSRLLFSGVAFIVLASIAPQGRIQSAPGVGFPLLSGTYVGPAPSLGVQDGVFTVNGQKKFLVFGSYFGALRDAIKYPQYVVDILNSAKGYGFDGIRVFPMWWNDPPNADLCVASKDPNPLILGNGWINTNTPSGLVGALPSGVGNPSGYPNTVAGRFQFLLDVAYEKGLLVDVSFAPETVAGLDDWDMDGRAQNFAEYSSALQTLAHELSLASYPGRGSIPPQTGYRHVYFDMSNESDYAPPGDCKPIFTETELTQLRNAVKQGDPSRLVTASVTGESTAWDRIDTAGFDLVAYHESRFPQYGHPWYELVDERLMGAPEIGYLGWRQVTNDAIPILFQEPERHRFLPQSSCAQTGLFPPAGCADNYSTNNFLTAMKLAKQFGAAGWTFHTERLFRFASNYSPGMSAVEGTFIDLMSSELASVGWPR